MCGQSPMPISSNKHNESFDSQHLAQQEKGIRVKLGAKGEINLLKTNTKELEDPSPGTPEDVEDHKASLLFQNQGETLVKNS